MYVEQEADGKHSELRACRLLHVGYLLGLVFDPEEGGTTFFRHVGGLPPDYKPLYPKRSNLITDFVGRAIHVILQ
jgi:hypothetical protein